MEPVQKTDSVQPIQKTDSVQQIQSSTSSSLSINPNLIEEGQIFHTISPSLSSQTISENIPINPDYRSSLEELKEKCANYKKAHSYCKSVHFACDKSFKVITLLLSSLTTYSISSHNEGELTDEDLEMDKKLTFATTIVSGISAIFSFSDKSEIHKTLVADYLKLYNEISHKIHIMETEDNTNLKEFYNEIYDRFTVLNDRTTEIGLMIYAKRKHNIL